VDPLHKDRKLVDSTNWTAGLVEIPVSQDKKIENIEQIEKLKLKMMQKEAKAPAHSTFDSKRDLLSKSIESGGEPKKK